MSARPRGPATLAAVGALCVILLMSSALRTPSQAPVLEWPVYGGPGQTRDSPLNQINRSNVRHLQVAWAYDAGEQGGLTGYIVSCSRREV